MRTLRRAARVALLGTVAYFASRGMAAEIKMPQWLAALTATVIAFGAARIYVTDAVNDAFDTLERSVDSGTFGRMIDDAIKRRKGRDQ